MSPSTIADRLPRWRVALYALPAMALAALGLPVMVLLPTAYAEDLGLGLSGAALALTAARLTDCAIDPLIGWFCDRSPGGRKLWFLVGLPLLLWGGWHLFSPSGPVSVGGLALWSILFGIGVTLVTVPYQAWGVDLSANEGQRLTIASWREAFHLFGILTAMVAYSLSHGGDAERLSKFFPPVAVLLSAAFLAAVMLVREHPPVRGQPKGPVAVSAPLRRNRSFLRLMVAQTVNALANGLPATLFLPYVAHRLGQRDAAGPLLLIYFSASIVGIPLWLRIARTLQKMRTWRWSLGLTALAFAPSLLLGNGDIVPFGVVCLLTGLGLAGDLALPAAILAETVHDGRVDGERSAAGWHVALWALAGKLGLAFAVAISFPILNLADQSAQSGLALTLLYAGLPILLKLSAVGVLGSARPRMIEAAL